MLETISIICMIVVVGFIAVGSAKSAGKEISRMTAPHSGCSVHLTDDGKYYDLWYMGPNHHIETAWVPYCSVRNKVMSLSYDNKEFEALIRCKDYGNGPVLREEKVKARTLEKLAEIIEEKFKIWDFEDNLSFLWDDFYTDK